MHLRSLLALLLAGALGLWAQKYNGPRPPMPDVLYLVHADNLIPTESLDAKAESKKNETSFTIPGASSPSRTPLAEPIFIIQADKIDPQRLELYRVEVKGGHREVSLVTRRGRGGSHPLRMSVTRLDQGLYKIEADEALEDGEYSISPNDSNHVFCFEVY